MPFSQELSAQSSLTPFAERAPVRPRSFFERLVGRSQPHSAEHAIANLFVETDPGHVPIRAVCDALAAFGVPEADERAILRNVYARALRAFLADGVMEGAESSYLERLQGTLNLGTDEIEEALTQLASPILKESVRDALADDVLTDEERRHLVEIGQRLRLPREITRAIYHDSAHASVRRRLEAIIEDRRVSPDEMQAFVAHCRELGANLADDAESIALLRKFTRLWEIENLPLDAGAVPIVLQRDERCLFSTETEWHELRTVSHGSVSAGPIASVRLIPGVRVRVGAYARHRISSVELRRIDDGIVYITNKRVIFQGGLGNKAVTLKSLLGVELFSDAVKLEKTTAKSPYLKTSADPEIVATVVMTAIGAA